jgi:thiol-disulfide isomerase/thioredoxin
LRARIEKNINLLTLEGHPAPPLAVSTYLGPKPEPLSALRGHPVLLFFWAHWCSDCKFEIGIVQRLRAEFQGLVLVGPTQRYGYAAGGESAGPQAELKYIDSVRRRYYAVLGDMPVPVSKQNFDRYGASTTPTLVLVDRGGIVRLYHPGILSYEDLRSAIEKVVAR